MVHTWGFNPTFQCSVPGLTFSLFCLFLGICHLFSSVMLHHTPLNPYGDCLQSIYSGRGVTIGPNILWSTPFPTQQSTSEVTLREFPWMLKQAVHGRHMMLLLECFLHCTSPENGIQTEHNMQADTEANLCIPASGQSSMCQQTKILVPPWKSVLGGTGAMPEWSRSFWTTLGCATYCTWCDHPRWSCISRCTIHRWHMSWGGGIFNSSHGFIHFTLLFVRIDRKQIVPMQGLAALFPIPGAYHIKWHIRIGPLFHTYSLFWILWWPLKVVTWTRTMPPSYKAAALPLLS